MNSELKDIYYDPSQGYISANKLKKKLNKIPIKDINEFIQKQEVSQIYSQPKKVYFPIIAYRPKQMYQIDLMFYENLKPFNKNRGIFLNCVDIYSRYAWSEPLTNKTAVSCKNALERIFKDGTPEIIQCDSGSEFKGAFAKYCSKNNIELRYVYPGDKTSQSVVERFNRTIRDKINRYLQAQNTNSFINFLPNFISNYNDTIHSTIKQKPYDIFFNNVEPMNLDSNIKRIEEGEKILNSFKVGDKVRVLNRLYSKSGDPITKQFTKGMKTFSKTLHTITKIDGFIIHIDNSDVPYKIYEVKKVDEIEQPITMQQSKKREQKVQHKPGIVERPKTRGKKIDFKKLISSEVS
jgi:hypothetical protein